MKSVVFLTSFFLLAHMNLQAQSKIVLPDYKKGQYECDTVYKHFGGLPNSGKGSISFTGNLSANLLAGVKFYMVVDSIDPSPGPLPSAFIDSLGTKVALRKATYALPCQMDVFSGKIRFYLVIGGTPVTSGESYLCDLTSAFTLGDDWNLVFFANTPKTCVVDEVQGVDVEKHSAGQLRIYPNPVADQLAINGVKGSSGKTYNIYDKLGRKVQTGLVHPSSAFIDVQYLLPGDYLIQIDSELQTLKFVKN
jgi:hypothetical protein